MFNCQSSSGGESLTKCLGRVTSDVNIVGYVVTSLQIPQLEVLHHIRIFQFFVQLKGSGQC